MNERKATIAKKDNQYHLNGSWTLRELDQLKAKITSSAKPLPENVIIDSRGIVAMDTSGAWFLYNFIKTIQNENKQYQIVGLKEEYQKLFDDVKHYSRKANEIPETKAKNTLEWVGMTTVVYCESILSWFSFIGETFMGLVAVIIDPQRIRWKYFFNVIEVNGYRALPIIAFLSFLIGIVLTYQIGLELRTYGANIFIINLLGLAILREFAPLMTAIILTGRTGSAFTAQLGVMQINEEIDALKTMGHSPIEFLVLPRVFGLILVLPLLTLWADIFGVAGGMIMSKYLLGISYYSFISRFPSAVSLTTFLIGIGKAPVFALIIASAGCFHGFRVKGSSESIGHETTQSVVLAIFLVIIADALFSILFSTLGI